MSNTPLTPRNRQEEWYQEIIDTIGGGGSGSSLPEVTSADNGKVLEVVNGEWSKSPDQIPITGREVENTLYTETLGEMVEFDFTLPFVGTTQTALGIEAVGMTADIAETIDGDASAYPAPMRYTYSIGDYVAQNSSDASEFSPVIGDDGKYYFVAENPDGSKRTVFYGASGSVVKIYKTALEFPDNVINMYDPDDPHGDETYYPSYASYDETYGVVIDETFDGSALYKRLIFGQPIWVRYCNVEDDVTYFRPQTEFAMFEYDGGNYPSFNTSDDFFIITNYGQLDSQSDDDSDDSEESGGNDDQIPLHPNPTM